MTAREGSAGGLKRAMSVEVRLTCDAGHEPVWAGRLGETGHEIADVVAHVVKEVMGGLVELEQNYLEPSYFAQMIGVYAAPSATHREILSGDLHWLVSRLEEKLAGAFPKSPRPVVHLDTDRDFFASGEEEHGGAIAVREPPAEPARPAPPPPPPIMAQAQPAYGAPPPAPAARSPALMWTGAALGGMVIAGLFLLMNNMELRRQVKEFPGLQAKVSSLTVDLERAKDALSYEKSAREYERNACSGSIAEHREMINDLARQCKPASPPPRPPAEPTPYPPRPDPFERP